MTPKILKIFIPIFLFGFLLFGLFSLVLAVNTNFTITVDPLIQCNDGIDNDGDGFIDYPDDPECASLTDNIEGHQQCSDNYDNDSDGFIDYPADPGCVNVADNNETDQYQCSDGIDNDGDGKIDYPDDPGCTSLTDNNEYDIPIQCSDGIDNDGDGKIDYPADPGCANASDNDETDSSGNSGSPGGNPGFIIQPTTSISMSGRAYPDQTVTLLKDAQVYLQTIAGPDARFTINLTSITPGNYNFSLYAESSAGRRSSLYSFPLYIPSGANTQVDGIFLSPTITTDKEVVKKGDNIIIFGYTVPNSDLTILIGSDQEILLESSSDVYGAYLYNYNSADLDKGDHTTKSRAILANEVSPFSKSVAFKVGDVNIDRSASACSDQMADLNCDGKVNLVDFSIAAFWYKKTLSAEFAVLEKSQLNGDGNINLADFSIMAYYWSG